MVGKNNLLLVTGANGFIGRYLCRELINSGHDVRSVVRNKSSPCSSLVQAQQVVIGDIGPDTQWNGILSGVGCVIHLAARVHIMKEGTRVQLDEYRRVNLEGTVQLAKMAASVGVKRFIYISSIKVNGELSGTRPFTSDDKKAPIGPYATSKAEAERQLHCIFDETGMKFVIIRPPLVYGPGVRGNFLRLLRVIDKGMPLPLSSVKNKRSMASLENITSLIIRCIEHKKAAGEIFLVSDDNDWSTPHLVQRIAYHMGRPTRVFPVPVPLLKLVGTILGSSNTVSRLCGSLEVEIGKTKNYLDWTPPQTPDEGVRQAVEWYLDNKNAC